MDDWVIAFTECGKVLIYANDRAVSEDQWHRIDLINGVVLFFNMKGQPLEPKGAKKHVEEFQINEGYENDPIGLCLSEACELVPNHCVSSIDDLKEKLIQAGADLGF